MHRSRVKSSTLLSAGYDPDRNILELEFTSEEVYQYYQVPAVHFTGLMKAASQGEYFNAYIKDHFSFKKATR